MSLLGCAHLPFQACPLREGEAECGRVGAELIWTQVVDVPAGIHFGCGCNLVEPIAERLDSGLPADVGLRLCKERSCGQQTGSKCYKEFLHILENESEFEVGASVGGD